MALSDDEREALIDEVDPESVSEDQINKISMGIYHDEHLREKAISLLIDISLASPNAVTETAARSLNDALTNKEAITRKQAARAVTNFCQTQPSIFEDSVQTIINIISDNIDYMRIPHAVIHEDDLEPGADLSETFLYDEDLSNADLSEADLSDGPFIGSPGSKKTDLSEANLSGADLSDAVFDGSLSGADLSNAFACGAVFPCITGADLSDADFYDGDFQNTDFAGADLTHADFSECLSIDFTGADFTNADLSGADFTGADLSGSNLSEVYLSDTSLEDADLTDATLPES